MLLAKNTNWRKIILNQDKNITVYFCKNGIKTDSGDGEIIVKSQKIIKIPQTSLTQYIYQDFSKWGDKPAVTCGITGRSFDYHTLQRITSRVTTGLISKTGCNLKPRDTIGIILPNIPEFPAVVYGALDANLQVTSTNPLYTPEEITNQFLLANVKLIVTIDSLISVAVSYSKVVKNYKGTVIIGGADDLANKIYSFQSLVVSDHNAKLPIINFEDTALLPFSSGTTGLPKGVELTHRNLIANCEQTQNCQTNKEYKDTEIFNESVLVVPPFFHIYGFNVTLGPNLRVGNHIIVLPRFTSQAYINCLIQYRPKSLFVVPSLLLFLASHPAVRSDHLTSVEEVLVGSAAAPIHLIEKFRTKCGANIKVRQGYGMTESSPVTLCTPLNCMESKLGSVGIIFPGTEAKIVSTTDGKSLGPDLPGELYVRGPQIMKGYLNDPESTKDILTGDNWLKTGDIAYYDKDEYFYIVDRTKELIKVKGMQVSPTELENIIIELPTIADVAVVGMLDEVSGELPKAFVVLRTGAKVTKTEIMNHVNKRVVKYKHIKEVKFIKKIPRNAAGKVNRTELKIMTEDVDL